MTRFARALLGLLFLLASCRSFEFEREQVFLRYSPETDVLDAVFVYRGIRPAKEEAESEKVFRNLGAGRRHFMFFEWPLDVDLDAAVEKLDPKDELAARFLGYQENIHVMSASFLMDEWREPCLLQRVQVRNASGGLRIYDAFLNRCMLELLNAQATGDDLPSDPRSREQIRKRAESQGSWVRFEGASVVVSVPMTPEEGAKHLRELAGNESANEPFVKALLDSFSAIQLDADGLRIKVSPAADGWITLTFDDAKRRSDAVDADEPLPDGFTRGELAPAIARFKAMK